MPIPVGAELAPPSIADRRREFMVSEIERAAIRVFVDRGYESVTVADLAAAAGVSRRTFFRYFPSKDDVLWAQSDRLQARVLAALQRRPSTEPPVEAVCNAFLDTAVFRPEEAEWVAQRNRILADLNTRTGVPMTPHVVAQVTELVAERMGADPATDFRPRLVVSTLWAAAEVASNDWATTGGTEPLAERLATVFKLVRDGLRTLDRT